jgi:hypothetical protein
VGVIRVREGEVRSVSFVAGDERVADGRVHPLTTPLQPRPVLTRVVAEDGGDPFIVDRGRPARGKKRLLGEADEKVAQSDRIQDTGVQDGDG